MHAALPRWMATLTLCIRNSFHVEWQHWPSASGTRMNAVLSTHAWFELPVPSTMTTRLRQQPPLIPQRLGWRHASCWSRHIRDACWLQQRKPLHRVLWQCDWDDLGPVCRDKWRPKPYTDHASTALSSDRQVLPSDLEKDVGSKREGISAEA